MAGSCGSAQPPSSSASAVPTPEPSGAGDASGRGAGRPRSAKRRCASCTAASPVLVTAPCPLTTTRRPSSSTRPCTDPTLAARNDDWTALAPRCAWQKRSSVAAIRCASKPPNTSETTAGRPCSCASCASTPATSTPDTAGRGLIPARMPDATIAFTDDGMTGARIRQHAARRGVHSPRVAAPGRSRGGRSRRRAGGDRRRLRARGGRGAGGGAPGWRGRHRQDAAGRRRRGSRGGLRGAGVARLLRPARP